MTKNDKKEIIETILEDLAKERNDTTVIEDNIIKLMKDEEAIKKLIYYLNKCDPIMLLRIKSNLENYKEITKFKRDVYIPNTALVVSFVFSGIAILFSIVEDKNIFLYIGYGIEVLLVCYLLYLAIEFTDIKRITALENYIEEVLYLVNFMLKNKKDDLNEYSENLYTINKKAPVKNTSAEK